MTFNKNSELVVGQASAGLAILQRSHTAHGKIPNYPDCLSVFLKRNRICNWVYLAPVCYSTSGNSITNGNSEDGDDGDTDGADDGEQLGCWSHFRHTTVIFYG